MKRFGFLQDRLPRGNATTSNYPRPTYDISVATSNVADQNIADTITFTFDTNLPDKTVYWAVSNTSTSIDFTDGITNGSFVLDAFGNATFNKQILINSTDNVSKNFNFLFSHNNPLSSDTFFTQQANITASNVVVSTTGSVSTLDDGESLVTFNVGNRSNAATYNFTVTSGIGITGNVLLVAAGGGGGRHTNSSNLNPYYNTTVFNLLFWGQGGGGGGQVLETNVTFVNNETYAITVGNAGNGVISDNIVIYPEGGNTEGFGYTVVGGGVGGGMIIPTGSIAPPSLYSTVPPTRGGGGVGTFSTNTGSTNSFTGYKGGNGASFKNNDSTISLITFPSQDGEGYYMGGSGAGAAGNATNANVSTTVTGPGTFVDGGQAGRGYHSNITGTLLSYGYGGRGQGGFIKTNSFTTVTGSLPPADGIGVNGQFIGSGFGGGGTATFVSGIGLQNAVGLNGVVYVKYKPFQKALSI